MASIHEMRRGKQKDKFDWRDLMDILTTGLGAYQSIRQMGQQDEANRLARERFEAGEDWRQHQIGQDEWARGQADLDRARQEKLDAYGRQKEQLAIFDRPGYDYMQMGQGPAMQGQVDISGPMGRVVQVPEIEQQHSLTDYGRGIVGVGDRFFNIGEPGAGDADMSDAQWRLRVNDARDWAADDTKSRYWWYGSEFQANQTPEALREAEEFRQARINQYMEQLVGGGEQAQHKPATLEVIQTAALGWVQQDPEMPTPEEFALIYGPEAVEQALALARQMAQTGPQGPPQASAWDRLKGFLQAVTPKGPGYGG